MLVSEASHDDLTAAKAVALLVYVVGYRLGREQEAEFWARFGHAVLDRIGGDQRRLRAWILEKATQQLDRDSATSKGRGC